MKNKIPKIIAIVGQTASGKSDLGIKLARKFNGEIISADSRQVYRGMDMGTGKVLRDKTLPKLKFKILNLKFQNIYYSGGIPHHLLDIASPKKIFTVSDFKKLGQKAIDDIVSRYKLPIIVGGTGFYVDVLLGRIAIAEVPPNPKLRAQFEKLTVELLFEKLKRLDPERAKIIDSKNKRRLIRALEILESGQKIPVLNTRYHVLWLGLKPKNLEERIKERLEKRLKQGMVAEVKKLRERGVSKKRLYDLGLEYRWVSRYLNREMGYKKMREGLLRDITKYSKRQMTWFKKNKEIHWLAPSKVKGVKNRKEAEKIIRKFLTSHP